MKPPAWSYSSLNAFETCPRQFYHYKVAKDVKEPANEAAAWGNRFHEAADRFFKTRELAAEMEQYRPYLEGFVEFGKGATLLSEQKLAINRDLMPCDWFAKDVWCRGIVDVLTMRESTGMAYIDDHKSGKKKPDSGQLKLFSLLVFAHYPRVQIATTSYRWLQHIGTPEERTTEFHYRSQEHELWGDFLPRLKQFAHAFKTETFTPRPSGLCRKWCAVTECPHCGGE